MKYYDSKINNASAKKKKKTEQTNEEFTKAFIEAIGGEEKLRSYLRHQAPPTQELGPVAGEEEKRTWVTKGAFEDGYQFGDVTKTIGGTVKDIRENLIAGILGIGEGVVDAGADLVGGIHSAFGADKGADALKEFVSKELIDEEKIAKDIVNVTTNPVLDPTRENWGFNSDLFSKEHIINTDDISVLGEKSDSLVQSAGQLTGQLALASVGVPWWVTSGVTSFGGEAENAFNNGASYGEAIGSGLISAGAEILSEKLFGGSGLGEKGMIPVNDLTKGISNKMLKICLDFGIDVLGEGGEELFSQIASNAGSALYKEEGVWELLTNEEALDGYLESLVGGAVLGGVGSGGKAIKSLDIHKGADGKLHTGNLTDYRTGLNAVEEKVVNKEVSERISEREASGEKLSRKEKAQIEAEVMEDLGKGAIRIESIEEALGGDDYDAYIKAKADEDSLINEYSELGKLKDGEITVEQRERRNELKEQIKDAASHTKSTELKNKLGESVYKLSENSRLSESYNQREQRTQRFQADIESIDKKYRETYKRAADSGIINNSQRAHEFVELIAKISADKGISFDFTNNKKLKESGFAIEGKTLNGYVTPGGITLNMDSSKAWQSTVGHEVAHVLEGTEMYSELQSLLTDYAKSKGEYDSRYDAISKLYKDVEGTNVDAELTAELIGEYIFSDEGFVSHLSTQNRNIFQKIYDEIKYLAKLATAGSKEARQIEKVRRVFEKVYREGNSGNNEIRYSIETTEDGAKFTVIAQDSINLLMAQKGDTLPAKVRAYFRKYRNTVLNLSNKDKAYIRRESENEYTNPAKRIDEDLFSSKLKASSELENLLSASKYLRHSEDSGRHPDAVRGWNYYQTTFAIPIENSYKVYTGEIAVKLISRGDCFYDITKIKDITAGTDGQAFLKAAISKGNVSNNIISQNTENVNRKNSYSSSENNGVSTVYNVGKIKKDNIPSATKIVAGVGSKSLGMMPNNIISQNTENVNRKNSYFSEDIGPVNNAAQQSEKVYREGKNEKNTADSGVRYSLESVDGIEYVKAEKNIFTKEDGTPATEREIFNSLVGKTISLPDGDITIVKRLPGKDMYDELYRRYPKTLGGVSNPKKLNADVNHNFEELIGSSEILISNEPDYQNRHQKQGIISYDTRKVKFFDGIKAYDIEFSIATLENGEKVAYAKKYYGYNADLTKKIQATEGRGNQSPFNQQPVSNIIIPQPPENVNRKNSYSFEDLGPVNNAARTTPASELKYEDIGPVREDINQQGAPTQDIGPVREELRYSISQQFYAEYDAWDKRDPRKMFTIGNTSDVLKKLGVKDSIITWDSSKIIKIKSKHAEMTDDIIKQVPNILDSPIIVLKSLQSDSRLTLFGEVYADGKPVLAVLELNPTGRNGTSLDEIKIASAYGKDNVQSFINRSETLYVDADKKRVSEWEMRTGLQLPVGTSSANSNNIIPDAEQNVNSNTENILEDIGPVREDIESIKPKASEIDELIEPEYKTSEEKVAARIVELKDRIKALNTYIDGLTQKFQDEEQRLLSEWAHEQASESERERYIQHENWMQKLEDLRDQQDSYETYYKGKLEEAKLELEETTEGIIDLSNTSSLHKYIAEHSDIKREKAIMQYLVEKFSGRRFTLSDGISATMDKTDAKELSHKASRTKIAELSQLRKVIEKAKIEGDEIPVEHNKFSHFRYYTIKAFYQNKIINLQLNVGKSKFSGDYHIYEINRGRANRQNGLSGSVDNRIVNASSNNIIPDNAENVNSNTENILEDIGSVREDIKQQTAPMQDIGPVREDIAPENSNISEAERRINERKKPIIEAINKQKQLRSRQEVYNDAEVIEDYDNKIKELEAQLAKLDTPKYKRAVQRQVKQEEYRGWAKRVIGDTSTWGDKKLGISYKTNTLRRNLRDIVRKGSGEEPKNGKLPKNVRDIERADAIYEELQGTYNRNEAALKRESNRLKSFFIAKKITKAEDAYIQMLGELRANPETDLTEEAVQKFYEEHKKNIDIQKVEECITEARAIYDELIVRVNEVLREQGMREIPYRKGYFPHFIKERQSRLAKLLNWKTVTTEIPTDIAGITEQFNPKKSYQSFDKQRTGNATDYSFTQGFDTYLHGALDWIYHIDDIQKRRAVENYIRYTHSDEGIKKRIQEIRENEEYDADEMQDQIDNVYKDARNPLNNFVTDLRAGTNALANKKSSLDRSAEETTNRKIYSVMTNITNRVSANQVVASISSALTNFIPITQSWLEVSPISSLRAMYETIRSMRHDDGTIDKSNFLTNRLHPEEMLNKTAWDNISDKAGILMNVFDSFTSQVVWRSKFNENMKSGMSENEAIRNADQFAENVLAGRSRGNMPTLFHAKNPIAKLFTAFQLEVNNQYGYMFKDAPQDLKSKGMGKLIKGYGTMFLGAYAYNALYSSLTGRDAAFDPIGIITDLLKDIFDDEEDKASDIILGFTDEVLDEVPFVGGLLGGGRVPISSALPYGSSSFSEMLKDIENGNVTTLTKEWLKPLYYIAMPMGGGQLKKTIEGLSMFSDKHPISGSYTDKGELRFPVEDNAWNRIQAGVFGQWSSGNARDYFDGNRKPLNEKQMQEFLELGISIQDYWKYRDGLKDLDGVEAKFDYIDSLNLTLQQKNLLINNLLDRKEPVDMEGYGNYSSYDEYDFATNYPGEYTVSKAISNDFAEYDIYRKALSDLESDKDKNGNSISGSLKKKKVAYINGLDIEYGQKIILYKSQYKSDNRYNTEIVEYLNSREDISYSEMADILTELGFRVYADGTVRWG